MSLDSIEKAIDVTNMDTKNISKLIESYSRYNIVENYDINYIIIETVRYEMRSIEEIYCEIDNYYYLLFLEKSLFKLKNEKMILVQQNEDGKEILSSVEKNPEQYIFLISTNELPYRENYNLYKIQKKFKNKDQFQKHLKNKLKNYKNLLYNGFIPKLDLDIKGIGIYYNDYNDTLWKFENIYENEDEIIESFNELRNIGTKLGNIIDNIVNLI